MSATHDINLVIRSLQKIPGMTTEAVREAVDYYGKKLIVRHFQTGNATAYNYPALSPQYKKRKSRRYGNTPQLVASGRLKKRVVATAKGISISPREVRLIVKYPIYGAYQVQAGRNWYNPNKRDWRDILRKCRRALSSKRRGRR